MFARVSATFSLLRAIMAALPAKPNAIVLASNTRDIVTGGRIRAMRALDSYDWTALSALARDDIVAPVATHLNGESLTSVRTVVVLDRAPSNLTEGDRATLIAILKAGGTVVAAAPIAKLLVPAAAQARAVTGGGAPAMSVRKYALSRGSLIAVAGGPVERLFNDSNQNWAGDLTSTIFHRPVQASGYYLSAAGVTLLYSGQALRGASMAITLPLASDARTLTVFDTSGSARQTIPLNNRPGLLRVYVPRRGYAMAVPAL
jgi:hypothetical protein